MEAEIKQALAKPPDYSARFTGRMEAIRRRVEGALGTPTYLDSDMNYSASQKISIFLDRGGCPVSKGDDRRRREVVVLLSSRADLYTIVQVERINGNEWRVVEPAVSCDSPSDLVRIVEDEGYRAVPMDDLHQPAPGCVTQIDAAPATVFQVLFSEMY